MKISVLVCTYNGERFIQEQLTSILEQTRLPDEIIVCDDNSDDDTVGIVREVLAGYSVPAAIFVNETNLGFRKNFEQGILKCTGDWIALSDQDDVWMNNRLQEMERSLESDTTLCYSDWIITNTELKPIESILSTLKYRDDTSEFLVDSIENLNIIHGCRLMVRTDVAKRSIPFEFSHDHYLCMTAPVFGKVKHCDQKLMFYRRHNSAATFSTERRSMSSFILGVKKSMKTEPEIYFNWPHAYALSLANYKDRFGENLKSVNGEAYSVLCQKMEWYHYLSNIGKKNRVISIPLLVKEYLTDDRYRKYRGGKKRIILDLLYLAIHY